jgi:hypothetical protein
MRWTGHVALMGEMINVYSILVGKPEGKRLLRRPSRRWGDNIRVIQVEVFCTVTPCSVAVGYQRFGGSMDL